MLFSRWNGQTISFWLCSPRDKVRSHAAPGDCKLAEHWVGSMLMGEAHGKMREGRTERSMILHVLFMLNLDSVLPLHGSMFTMTSIKFSWVLQLRDPWDTSIFLKHSKIMAWLKQAISCSNFYYLASKTYAACPFFSFLNQSGQKPKAVTSICKDENVD